jgi:hypothetical protein
VLPPWSAPAALVAPPVEVLPALVCTPPLPEPLTPLPAEATDMPPLPLVVASDPAVPAEDPPLGPEGVLLEQATSDKAIVQVIGWIRMSFSIESRLCV